jgi:hypothetical protein
MIQTVSSCCINLWNHISYKPGAALGADADPLVSLLDEFTTFSLIRLSLLS